jgi:hypothetical protein
MGLSGVVYLVDPSLVPKFSLHALISHPDFVPAGISLS